MLKLIAEIKRGMAFHYFGSPDRVYIKDDPGHAIAPGNGRVRVSETTLVVPHEGKSSGKPIKKVFLLAGLLALVFLIVKTLMSN